MHSLEFSDHFTKDLLTKINEYTSSTEENFCKIAKMNNLNPETDFKHSDLRDVCFNDCDLSGFDFTGADLTGSSGLNTQITDSTILCNALTDQSLFTHIAQSRVLFSNNKKLKFTINHVSKKYWNDQIGWIDDELKKTSSNREETFEVAKALLAKTKDSVVRSNILFFASRSFSDPYKHRDFLIGIISTEFNDKRMVMSALNVLSSLFNDNLTFKWFKKIYDYPNVDNDIRNAAMRGILKLSEFSNHFTDFLKDVASFPSDIRRTFVYRVSKRFSNVDIAAIRDPYLSRQSIDFEQTLTERIIRDIARAAIKNGLIENVDADTLSRFSDPSEKAIATASLIVITKISYFIKIGIPFNIEVKPSVFEKIIKECNDREQKRKEEFALRENYKQSIKD